MPLMPITESMFLLAETREHPMHVGGLQLFVPPDGEAEDFGEFVYETFCKQTDVARLFRKRPASPVNVMGTLRWTHDKELDFDYHVRRAVLPRPGRIRELLKYVSAQHGGLMDRHRPMWEVHVIEGLADGRLALYTKVHHSLVDGVSALRLLERALSPDPEARDCKVPWDPALFRRPKKDGGSRGGLNPLHLVSDGVKLAGDIASLAPAGLRIGMHGLRDPNLVLPTGAPKTMLNVPIGGARRFAAQQWPKTRIRSVAKILEISTNDVIIAMCAGALRSYLLDRNALPSAPLIAMVPVSMREAGADYSEGNAVTTMLCNLGTNEADPARRLAVVTGSTRQGKRMIKDLTPMQALGFGGVTMAPLLFSTVPGFVRYTPPPFNIVISNVPGSSRRLYWNGARLDGVYPVSIALDGQALNITVTMTAGKVNFGLIGARSSIPHLQRLLVHLENALTELEKLGG
ncbi:wax ester/triacylglycerol synthase family O-acyltransferase [Williamsia sp. DF01-3]|uniref:WS/DGAT/MGAT family O-acyltransferase n=1 Tax=Williamsia sp. DF01-3 TaxID=2934157 RepID=UPI001FF5680A|nr:wax ester/triacylglycerol synthase family O-acyltransferase [Williamsia sp. DF01-3]MCK0520280.1 wax ester/triacylglycerol synthase family O-acyltransferase [Williamsia sp. DF01-3]